MAHYFRYSYMVVTCKSMLGPRKAIVIVTDCYTIICQSIANRLKDHHGKPIACVNVRMLAEKIQKNVVI